MSRSVRIAFKPLDQGWRERTFKNEREAWAFIVELDADVEVRWLDGLGARDGYAHAWSLIAKAVRA